VRWSGATSTPTFAAMKAVDVIDAPPVGTVTLVSPTGLRIEGVSIDAAITILRGIAIALAQHAQLQQLIRQLKRKCDTLSFYTGNKEELQQTLVASSTLGSPDRSLSGPTRARARLSARPRSGPAWWRA
jgi:hypothetical protein